jgi:hypothetical protein
LIDVATSEANVTTDRPARYGKQLVAHLSRRSTGEWSESDERGQVGFDFGRVDLTCEPGTLRLRVDGPAEELDRLEDVVGRHLVRFGTRDELVVTWLRADGSTGTEQRNTDADG